MGVEPQEFSETKLTPKKFVEKECETGKKYIPHTKMLPQCRNVTKQNCVTLWETDSDGKQVILKGKQGLQSERNKERSRQIKTDRDIDLKTHIGYPSDIPIIYHLRTNCIKLQ